jgi:hypothetical protein
VSFWTTKDGLCQSCHESGRPVCDWEKKRRIVTSGVYVIAITLRSLKAVQAEETCINPTGTRAGRDRHRTNSITTRALTQGETMIDPLRGIRPGSCESQLFLH